MKIAPLIPNQKAFQAKTMHPYDLKYKNNIKAGLKREFGINCEIKDLESIAAPVELLEIIKKLKPKDYEVGDNFRANFHMHTDASDGKLTALEFLEQCAEWANRVFKSGKVKDLLPPFSASITDHEVVTNTKKAVAIISQNPDKYKNFKFVTGCEFIFNGYESPYSAFEAVGLGFNPFDNDIESMKRFVSGRDNLSDIKKVIKAGGILSWAHPIYTPEKLNDDFFCFLNENGIHAVEGNYQYLTSDKDYINAVKPIVDKFINRFSMLSTGGTDGHRKTIF